MRMPLRLVSFGCAGLVLAGFWPITTVDARQSASLDEILRAAAGYVQQFQRAMSAVVTQERYEQSVGNSSWVREAGPLYRKTMADLLFFDAGPSGWVSFRDAYEADGQAVHDHDQRLTALLSDFAPDSLNQARRIAAESARFNLNPTGVSFNRTTNTPLTALLFLRAANQSRSAFRLGKAESINGVVSTVVTFTEQTKPRLIGSRDEAAANGTFWIDASTSRVVQTLLRLNTALDVVRYVTSETLVTFGPVPRLDVWPPLTMKESYRWMPTEQTLTTRAEYSNFRQFSVTVDEKGR